MSNIASGSPPTKLDQEKQEAVASPTTDMSGPAARDKSPMRAAPSLLPRVSDEEAKFYYFGLPSQPLLVARTGTIPYEAPTGPEAYHKPKEIRGVGNHKIQEAWGDGLGFKVTTILDEKNVKWTSIDLVRFCYEEERPGNVVVWIGVKPGTLSYERGIDAALQCKGLLLDHELNDVDVEIRESEVFRMISE